MSTIGIVGVGIVGSAIKYGFEKLGHTVLVHDIKLQTNLIDLLDTETIYICVPTPPKPDGSCDTTIVEEVVKDLVWAKYKGIIAIKSTVEPGTTDRLLSSCRGTHICFVPEFLRERCSITDFTENHDLCVVGTRNASVFNTIKEQHGKYPKNVVQLAPTEAELCKYFNNIYNATLITFANSFFEVCKKVGADYSKVKDAIVKRDHIEDIYLDCNENFRGFGGMCITPDVGVYTETDVIRADKITVGTKVLTHDGTYKSVSEVFVREYNGDIFNIKPQGRGAIRITPEHPILAVRANRRLYNFNGSKKLSNYRGSEFNLEWIKARQLSKGDYVFFPTPNRPETDSNSISPSQARLLGYYVAEGSVEQSRSNSKRTAFAFHSKENIFHADVVALINAEFGLNAIITRRSENSTCIRASGAPLFDFCLKHGGKLSWKKKLSAELMKSSNEVLAQFMLGYFRGDGSKSTGVYTMATVSLNLFKQLKLILARLGINFVFRVQKARISKDGVRHREAYYIRINDKRAMDKFAELLDEPEHEREIKLFRNTQISIEDGTLLPVKDITVIPYAGKVFNFEVEHNHTYVIEDFTVHNCLPKDTKAIARLMHETHVDFFSNLLKENSKYKVTVFDGMRKE